MLKVMSAVNDCNNGDILAQDVFNENGVLIIPENTLISPHVISKLKGIGVNRIYIYPKSNPTESTHTADSKHSDLANKYNNNVSSIKGIINDLASGKKLDLIKVNEITDSLLDCIRNKQDIIKVLGGIRSYDEYTYAHSLNVALYSTLIAKWMGLSESEVRGVMYAGLLHDIGKSMIPDTILNKKGKLTDEEFDVMKRHPLYGYNLIEGLSGLSEDILNGVLYHHEKYDGTGYPYGRKSSEISIYPRIIAVADVYDALTSERVYKKRVSPFETFHLFQSTGIGHFDLTIMWTFINNIANYYIGSDIKTNTGDYGKVVFVTPNNISKPIINVRDNLIDLSRNDTVKIVEIV